MEAHPSDMFNQLVAALQEKHEGIVTLLNYCLTSFSASPLMWARHDVAEFVVFREFAKHLRSIEARYQRSVSRVLWRAKFS